MSLSDKKVKLSAALVEIESGDIISAAPQQSATQTLNLLPIWLMGWVFAGIFLIFAFSSAFVSGYISGKAEGENQRAELSAKLQAIRACFDAVK